MDKERPCGMDKINTVSNMKNHKEENQSNHLHISVVLSFFKK